MSYTYYVDDMRFFVAEANVCDLLAHMAWYNPASVQKDVLCATELDINRSELNSLEDMVATAHELLRAKVERLVDRCFRDAGFSPSFDRAGNIVELELTSNYFGIQESFFTSIAPFVDDDSFFQCRGEDGIQWRWQFKDGEMQEFSGYTFYFRSALPAIRPDAGEACPLTEYLGLDACQNCPFGLVCLADGEQKPLRTAKCAACGGEVIIVNCPDGLHVLARATCTCESMIKRKWELPTPTTKREKK